jgi:hypothetical protein
MRLFAANPLQLKHPDAETPGLRCRRDGAFILPVNGLSEHLFWDEEREGVDPERHAAWLVKRVLEYGYWSDWQALVVYYGKPRLAQIVTGIRSLNPRAFAFCQAWFQLPATDFRCFTTPRFP